VSEGAAMSEKSRQEPSNRAKADQQRAPKGPTKLGTGSWFGVLRRSARGFSADNLTDRAAALTYYGIQAIFPALLALVSILGLLGRSATQPLVQNLAKVAPGPAQQIFTSAIENMQRSRGAAGLLVIAGFAVALWSASGYVGAFMRASNDIYGVAEGRPFWLKRPIQVLVTFVLVLLLAVSALAVVLTGGLATEAGRLLGIGQSAVTVWDIAKWPVLVLIVGLMFSILYWAAPNVRQPGFRWLTPGGILAVLLWIIASAAFAFYVANFSSYNKTYGSLAGIVVFLIWLWISNVAVLFGAELNSELERGRQLAAGQPAEDQLLVTPRMAPKGN
jgi:membrane protein